MPRRFREEEEQRIRAALLDAGRSIMGQRGVRKTTIDELARHAGISKGSFYRFFPGKEALALTVLAEWEREFHEELNRFCTREDPRSAGAMAEVLHRVFLELFPRRVMETGVGALLDPEEIAWLATHADPEHREQMDRQDLRLFEHLQQFFTRAGLAPRIPEGEILAGLRLLFEAGLHAMQIPREGILTAEHHNSALLYLIRGFVGEAFRQVARDAGQPDGGQS